MMDGQVERNILMICVPVESQSVAEHVSPKLNTSTRICAMYSIGQVITDEMIETSYYDNNELQNSQAPFIDFAGRCGRVSHHDTRTSCTIC